MPAQPQDRKAPRKRASSKKTSSPAASSNVGIGTPPQSSSSAAGDDARYAPTTWGSAPGLHLEDLVVPSGQTCLVRRPGVQGLLTAGVLHDIDSLTAIVDQEHVKPAKGVQQIDVQSVMKDPKALDNILHVTDRIVCHVVVKPTVLMTPNDITLREPGVIYADMIDIEDKMFILNYAVGGTRDLERFREELAGTVRGVDAVENVEGPTE